MSRQQHNSVIVENFLSWRIQQQQAVSQTILSVHSYRRYREHLSFFETNWMMTWVWVYLQARSFSVWYHWGIRFFDERHSLVIVSVKRWSFSCHRHSDQSVASLNEKNENIYYYYPDIIFLIFINILLGLCLRLNNLFNIL